MRSQGILAAALVAVAAPVHADEPAPAAADAQLLERMQRLEDELALLREDNAVLEHKVAGAQLLSARFSGYLDVGLFATTGNGAGTRSDIGNVYFPRYAGIVPGSWVFMGDPLSTAVNSRGDPADTGESRAVTFNPIASRGKSSFIVNALNLGLVVGVGDTGSLISSIDFVPRDRDVSNPMGLFVGDYLDVKLAYAEWRPELDHVSLALQAGKLDSVLGREYRALEAPDRTGVTPSLICRYTCGRPLGVKARAKLLADALIVNVAITNGSYVTEGFPFSSETDTNQVKTVAGRLSYLVARRLDLGVSGAWGAQDLQSDDGVSQWHVGGDLHWAWHDLELTAELVHGRANGQTSELGPRCDLAPCIRYTGAYGLASYRLTNVLEPYARVDWRDALHQSGASFVYISQLVRFTVGVRAELGAHVIVKAEATLDRELGGIPQFPNDVVTSSLVIKY
jgi:Putative beta-barrel porin-2, OmpL-like. bbp2